MEELGKADVLDPNPDIHALFCYYNSLYFSDTLGACSVSWSTPRMTRCAGVCHYRRSGGCEIRLSEPLLKFRPTSDLKNTLLHEMIHAFLWIENRNRDHSDHGPNFQRLMDDINCSPVEDHQRPAGGYNITIYHDFYAEVEKYKAHQWMCASCGDLIKRAINRAPSASDCIYKVKHYGSCDHRSCHWHRHKKECSGTYRKIAEPPGYEGKGLKGKHKHQKNEPKELSHESEENTEEKTATPHTEVGRKDKPDAKRIKTITNFFPVDTGNLGKDESSPTGDSRKHLCHRNSKGIVPKLSEDLVPKQTARGTRMHASRRKRKFTDVAQKYHSHESKYTVMSRWLDWYAEEEDGHEDIEPLINKRTERRKKQRTLMHSKRKVIEDERIPDAASTEVTHLSHLEVTESIDPVAVPSQDQIDDRGPSRFEVSGFCKNMDALRDLARDDGTADLTQSLVVNILEISDG